MLIVVALFFCVLLAQLLVFGEVFVFYLLAIDRHFCIGFVNLEYVITFFDIPVFDQFIS